MMTFAIAPLLHSVHQGWFMENFTGGLGFRAQAENTRVLRRDWARAALAGVTT
jgi:hypothetical protein